jgi:hypothetical protein
MEAFRKVKRCRARGIQVTSNHYSNIVRSLLRGHSKHRFHYLAKKKEKYYESKNDPIACLISGHYDAGMKGAISIEKPTMTSGQKSSQSHTGHQP